MDARNRAREDPQANGASADHSGSGMVAETPGVIRGPVVYFDAKKKEEFEKFRGKLKGAVVIYQEAGQFVASKPKDPEARWCARCRSRRP